MRRQVNKYDNASINFCYVYGTCPVREERECVHVCACIWREGKHLTKLQRVMNCAARLVCRASKCEHISPLLANLHWLPVSHRIEDKITSVCYNVISGSAPPYLAVLQLYTPSRSLRSSADSHIFCISIRCKKFQGQCAFSYTGLIIWNRLPFSVRHAQTLSSFKSQLKTHLFSIYFQAQ